MSIATIANSGASFVVAATFLTFLGATSSAAPSLMGLTVALSHFWKNVSETEGLTLHDIERRLARSS